MNGEMVSILLAIIVVLFSLGLIGTLVGRYAYKRAHNLPTGDCAYCRINKDKFLKEYRKKYHNGK